MTDSKTTDWAVQAADKVGEDIYGRHERGFIMWPLISESGTPLRDAISQALLSAYERGRKEGIEEAAKVAGAHQATPRLFPHGGSPTENEAAEAGQEFAADEIEAAIRQQLEVKG